MIAGEDGSVLCFRQPGSGQLERLPALPAEGNLLPAAETIPAPALPQGGHQVCVCIYFSFSRVALLVKQTDFLIKPVPRASTKVLFFIRPLTQYPHPPLSVPVLPQVSCPMWSLSGPCCSKTASVRRRVPGTWWRNVWESSLLSMLPNCYPDLNSN